jgi:hypothetical protein
MWLQFVEWEVYICVSYPPSAWETRQMGEASNCVMLSELKIVSTDTFCIVHVFLFSWCRISVEKNLPVMPKSKNFPFPNLTQNYSSWNLALAKLYHIEFYYSKTKLYKIDHFVFVMIYKHSLRNLWLRFFWFNGFYFCPCFHTYFWSLSILRLGYLVYSGSRCLGVYQVISWGRLSSSGDQARKSQLKLGVI